MDQSHLYQLYDREPEPIVAFLEHLRTLYGLPRPGVFLDMGCGPGRLLAPMAASGWTVVGYEPDPDYALQAEETLRSLPGGRFRQAGLLELDELQAFDLIAAVNGPYSYLLSPGHRREALQRCARALRPGGVLFLEFSNFHWILKNYREPPATQVNIGGTEVTRTAHHEIDYHNGTFSHQDRFVWTDPSGVDHEATKTHRMAIVSYPELADILEDLQFDEIRTFNGFDERESHPLEGRRILVAARAPATGPHLEPTQESGRAFLMRGIEGEVVMLNLLRFRDVADYAATPDLEPNNPISGAEAYQRYIEHTLPHLRESGGDVEFMGDGGPFLIGPSDERWDMALLVRHKSVQTFMSFASNEAYLGGMGHRLAAISDSRLLPITPRR